jgi:hypothetical protein
MAALRPESISMPYCSGFILGVVVELAGKALDDHHAPFLPNSFCPFLPRLL